MKQDYRDMPSFREAATLLESIVRPGSGQLSDAGDLAVSPDGKSAVFVGWTWVSNDASPSARIFRVTIETGAVERVTDGSLNERSPKFCPQARRLAFLSDRSGTGDYQLCILELAKGIVIDAPAVDGWIEHFHWSPDGKQIALQVAGYGATLASAQGAVESLQRDDARPTWSPTIDTVGHSQVWRSIWLFRPEQNAGYQLIFAGDPLNVWEFCWCGPDNMAIIGSANPAETDWYRARLYLVTTASGRCIELYEAQEQIGLPAATKEGDSIAFIEGPASDRGIIAGELRLLNLGTKQIKPVVLAGGDFSHLQWLSADRLFLAGHRREQTLVGIYDVRQDTWRETWTSSTRSTVGTHASAVPVGSQGDCLLIAEGFDQNPELAMIRDGACQKLHSFALGYDRRVHGISHVESISWCSADGWEIQGWVLLPEGTPPFPFVTSIHGGPTYHWHPSWLGRSGLPYLMLLKRGIGIFLPNPRGSSGRGHDFAKSVFGDMGGRDSADCLAGLDYLLEKGLADSNRLGIMGRSYGGYMASWLVTQDQRFAAAVAIAPVTNHVSARLLSNIPGVMDRLLGDSFQDPQGKYFERSPIFYADKVHTPIMHICGAQDLCSPPAEARQFHSALLENGTHSVLLTYPQEGHGVRKYPATVDYAARIADWFCSFLLSEAN